MKLTSINEINIHHVRRTWSHEINPCTRVIQSKKAYSRKDKSWKRDY